MKLLTDDDLLMSEANRYINHLEQELGKDKARMELARTHLLMTRLEMTKDLEEE